MRGPPGLLSRLLNSSNDGLDVVEGGVNPERPPVSDFSQTPAQRSVRMRPIHLARFHSKLEIGDGFRVYLKDCSLQKKVKSLTTLVLRIARTSETVSMAVPWTAAARQGKGLRRCWSRPATAFPAQLQGGTRE